MAMNGNQDAPAPGNWPVDPQEDVPILKERIWVDGCFDFAHHGKRAHSIPEATARPSKY